MILECGTAYTSSTLKIFIKRVEDMIILRFENFFKQIGPRARTLSRVLVVYIDNSLRHMYMYTPWPALNGVIEFNFRRDRRSRPSYKSYRPMIPRKKLMHPDPTILKKNLAPSGPPGR